VPYVDLVPEAINRFASTAPEWLEVEFTSECLAFCKQYHLQHGLDLEGLIRQILQQDPRPPYQQPEADRTYGMKLLELDIQWRYLSNAGTHHIQLVAITQLHPFV